MKQLKINKRLSEIFKAYMIARGMYEPSKTMTLEDRLNNFVFWAIYDDCHDLYYQSRYDLSNVLQQLRDYIDRLDDE